MTQHVTHLNQSTSRGTHDNDIDDAAGHNGGIVVHARPHPMSMETYHAEFPLGLTISAIVGPNALYCKVEIGGIDVPEEWWSRIKPRVGVAVVITRYPLGGSAKSIFRLIAFATLAIGVALISGGIGGTFFAGLASHLGITAGFAAGSISAGLLAAGVGVVGSLLINGLIPPQSPTAGATSQSTNLLSSITGTGNQVMRYGTVPCVVGVIRYYPPYAALPYTELSGDDEYLRCLFDLGTGDPDPSEMKIGDSDLASYTDVQTEIGTAPLLFSQDITESSAGVVLNTDGATGTRTSSASTDELSTDLSYSSGLFGVDINGNNVAVTSSVRVEYSPFGAGTWTSVTSSTPGLTISSPAASANGDGTIHVVNGERKAIRVGLRWQVGNGQYDVRVTRVSTNWGSADAASRIGDLTWTTLRSIRYATVSHTGSKKLAMRIKATDQLSGSISQFSCILAQPIPVWHQELSEWITEFSTNPAYVFRWLLKDSPANPRPIDVSRIDDVAIKSWAAECEEKEFCYSNSLDQPTTLFQLIKDVCAAGRAVFNMRDGKYGIVRDELQTVPVQVFTPRNSWGFGGNRAFPDVIHALRVQFLNPDANYQQDERIVYDDGYAAVASEDVGTLELLPSGAIATNGSINGWQGGSISYVSGGMRMTMAGDGAISSSFSVSPGLKYRFTFTGKVNGSGAQAVYLRVIFSPTYAAHIDSPPYQDFIAVESIASTLTTYSYDWVCPAGMFYASLAMYETSAAELLFTNVSARAYTFAQATKFEVMTIAGCTNANAAWRLGRYHLAVSRRRANTYFWNADIEHLVCSRGDLVQVANDVIGVGIAWGKVKSLEPPTGSATSMIVDEPLSPEAGKTYAIRVRRQDLSIALTQVTFEAIADNTTRLLLTTPTSGLNPDDLFTFGELGHDVIPMVITKIEPAADFAAKITAVDAAYEVLDADAGEPPAWTSQITGQPWLDAPEPPELLIIDSDQILSGTDDAGTTQPIMKVNISGPWSGRSHLVQLPDSGV